MKIFRKIFFGLTFGRAIRIGLLIVALILSQVFSSMRKLHLALLVLFLYAPVVYLVSHWAFSNKDKVFAWSLLLALILNFGLILFLVSQRPLAFLSF